MPDGERYRANWQDEIDSAAQYRALADLESDPRLAEVYRRLAAAEERHAGFWEERLRAAGARVPERRPGWRARLLIAVARRFGTQLVLPTLNDLERRTAAAMTTSRRRAAPRCRPTSARTRDCCGRWPAASRERGAWTLRGPPPSNERQCAAGRGPRSQRRAVVELQPRDGRGRRTGLGRHGPGDRSGRVARGRRVHGDG